MGHAYDLATGSSPSFGKTAGLPTLSILEQLAQQETVITKADCEL